jgi:NAD(P)-dependent dehydrogenase (short-subunit alcohol dehydrogenase family)
LPAAKDNIMTTQASPAKATKTKQTARKSAPTALITRASSGIGEAMAVCFAQVGYELILVARSGDKLQDLSQRSAQKHHASTYAMAAEMAGAQGRHPAGMQGASTRTLMHIHCE